MRGRRIAFDFGDVRTGVAICDVDGILASPLCVLQTQDRGFLQSIAELIQEHQPIAIYVGDPINMSGASGRSTEKVKAFVEELKSISSVEITLVDERLSTVSAQKKLKDAGVSMRSSKALIDAMAAVAILEAGLARHG